MSGVWLDHVWDMSGACLGHNLAHTWDNIWGILSTMDNTGQQSAVLHASVMPFLGKEKSEGNYFCPKLLLPLPVRLCPTFLWPDIRPRYFHPLQPANKRGQEKGKDNIPFISLPFACTAIWEPSVNCSHIWESHQSLNRCCILKCPHLKLASYQMYPIPPRSSTQFHILI